MTSAVLAMNARGLALAADATVTHFTANGLKHNRRGDKIFVIAEDPPVVVLAYRLLDIADVAWADLCAEYRRTTQPADSLVETARRFLNWVRDHHGLTTEMRMDCWRSRLTHVVEDFFPRFIDDAAYSSPRRCTRLIESLRREQRRLERSDRWLESVSRTTLEAQLVENRGAYTAVIDARPEIPALRAATDHVQGLLALSTCKPSGLPNSTGLVVAGYGTGDLLPSFLEVDTVTLERTDLRWSTPECTELGSDRRSFITGFAEQGETKAFLQGMHPDLHTLIRGATRDNSTILDATRTVVTKVSTQLAGADVREVLDRLHQRFQNLDDEIDSFSRQEFENPLLEGLSLAPRVDLAGLTRSLVEMEAWRHRLSTHEMETVGGKVKVVTLSRAQGIETG